MYVCGPSVYDDAHLGHARSYVAYDAMKRALRAMGWRVVHAQNFTDVEEEIAKRAKKRGIPPLQYADEYVARFFEDMDALGIERADHYPRVSEHIEDIKRIAIDLCESGHAYSADCRSQPHTKGGPCDVYFSVRQAKDFGALIGTSVEELAVEHPRHAGDRQSPLDFALWKTRDDWGLTWSSPWGPGRPGWHIECTAMATRTLGADFDIHGGGLDLVFPHHESERVIGEAWTGGTYCRYFLHNGFVTVGARKMSKSMGNFVTVRQALAEHDPETLRAFLLSAHYRAPLDYDEATIAAARSRLDRWRARARATAQAAAGHAPGEASRAVVEADEAFWAALADDFRYDRATDALDRLLDAAAREEGGAAATALARVRKAAGVFGVLRDA